MPWVSGRCNNRPLGYVYSRTICSTRNWWSCCLISWLAAGSMLIQTPTARKKIVNIYKISFWWVAWRVPWLQFPASILDPIASSLQLSIHWNKMASVSRVRHLLVLNADNSGVGCYSNGRENGPLDKQCKLERLMVTTISRLLTDRFCSQITLPKSRKYPTQPNAQPFRYICYGHRRIKYNMAKVSSILLMYWSKRPVKSIAIKRSISVGLRLARASA